MQWYQDWYHRQSTIEMIDGLQQQPVQVMAFRAGVIHQVRDQILGTGWANDRKSRRN